MDMQHSAKTIGIPTRVYAKEAPKSCVLRVTSVELVMIIKEVLNILIRPLDAVCC